MLRFGLLNKRAVHRQPVREAASLGAGLFEKPVVIVGRGFRVRAVPFSHPALRSKRAYYSCGILNWSIPSMVNRLIDRFIGSDHE